jgi:arylsulfatase A-like enzyme
MKVKYYLLLALVFTVTHHFQVSAQVNKKGKKPNVIFIMADQWRRQAVGFMKEDSVQTPHLDQLAKEGVAFKRAYAARPICSPNRASLLTGRYPINHHIIMNDMVLADSLASLGNQFKKASYQTMYIGKWHLDSDFDYTEPEKRSGFNDYWLQTIAHNHYMTGYFEQNNKKRQSANRWEPDFLTDKAIAEIDKNNNQPFTMVISYGPPHTGGGKGFEESREPGKRVNKEIKYGYGYGSPKKYEDMYQPFTKIPRRPNVKLVGNDDSNFVLPGYFGAITSIDENIGRLIKHLKDIDQYDNTIFVFTSDHGEMLGSHGKMTKGVWLEESVGVPLIITGPGVKKNIKTDKLINSIDILPTLLGLSKLPISSGIDGKDYSSFLQGKKFDAPNQVFLSFDKGSEQEKDRAWRTIITDDYSFTVSDAAVYNRKGNHVGEDGIVFYKLKSDPYQMSPIYTKTAKKDDGIIMKQLYEKLEDHLNQEKDNFLKTHNLK